MKPSRFRYHRPKDLADAVALLSDLGDDAKLLAGGQSLVPMMNLRLARPEHLVDAGRIDSLRGVEESSGGVTIGAMTTQRQIERSELISRRFPVLAEAVRHIAHPPIRVRGTIGGSLAHADPAAELPAIATLLDAEITATGPRGERVIPAGDFFLGFLTTSLEPDEVLTSVRLPKWPDGAGWAFEEISRRHGDFALAGVAALVRRRNGSVESARIALFGVGATPIRAVEAEHLAAGRPSTPETWQELARAATERLDPPADVHSTAAYRKRVAAVLVSRALATAFERSR